jgi:hypothetical protein
VNRQRFLCSGLDGQALPNGPQSGSLFAVLAARPEVTLACVSGRDRYSVEQAIADIVGKVPAND